MTQDLERSHDPRRRVRGASVRDRRREFSLKVRLTAPQRDQLHARAQAELRSVSGYVGRVLVEALARR